MARATIPSLLGLDGYARTMGLDPMHFNQAVSQARPDPRCPQVWYQYMWQNPSIVSREHLAECISEAERDLADQLGYWPAPVWMGAEDGEFHRYPRPQAPGAYGLGSDTRLRFKSVQLNRGFFIEGGQRAEEALGEACWVGLDLDGDGFYETAQFQLAVDADLDPCEVHAYFKPYEVGDEENCRTNPVSTGADPSWEVPIQATLSGTTLTLYAKTWTMFRPQLWEDLSPDDPIDADDFGVGVPTTPCALGVDLGSYVDGLAFYRVYNDPSTQVEFAWGADLCCSSDVACALTTQSGCMTPTSIRSSLVRLQPSEYNESTSSFTAGTWTQCVEPDAVRVWYRAGWTPATAPRHCQVLDDYWAKVITMLATCRLEWDLCECTNVKEVSDYWRQDAARMTREKSFNLRQEELSNPFGQKVGEVLAWRRLTKARGRQVGRAVLT